MLRIMQALCLVFLKIGRPEVLPQQISNMAIISIEVMQLSAVIRRIRY